MFASQLQMLGYDVSWAAFNIVEVMSSSKFTYKVRFMIYKEKMDVIVSVSAGFLRPTLIKNSVFSFSSGIFLMMDYMC